MFRTALLFWGKVCVVQSVANVRGRQDPPRPNCAGVRAGDFADGFLDGICGKVQAKHAHGHHTATLRMAAARWATCQLVFRLMQGTGCSQRWPGSPVLTA